MKFKVKPYMKTLMASIGAAAVAAEAALADLVLTWPEVARIAAAGLAVYAVWRVPNKPKEPAGI